MKTGILIHSKTGNTLNVAEKIMTKLKADGHSASIERIIAANDEETDINKIQLTNIPNISDYDFVIFGGPVRAFSLSPVLQAYLLKCESLHWKKINCFVTQHFPYPWMGGNRAIEQMKKLCESKDAKVINTAIINMKNKNCDKMIAEAVEKLSCIKSATVL
jgi:menaquinone-dependent protoporphyrinogen IX oxidase